MSPAIAAVFVLFNGQDLDGWKSVKGEWVVKSEAITCAVAPAILRTAFESDAYDLTFEYRGSNPDILLLNADLDGKSKFWPTAPLAVEQAENVLRLQNDGVHVLSAPRTSTDEKPSEEWITVHLSLRPDRVTGISKGRVRDGGSAGNNLTFERTGQDHRRGFIAFHSERPGLQIRNIKVTEPGFNRLFDGKTTKGWEPVGKHDPDNPAWFVENGVLNCRHTKWGNWLRTAESYDNFVLRLEYWLPRKGNSGIYLHAPATSERISQIGQEIQLIDEAGWGGKIKPPQRTGAVYGGIGPEVDVPAPAEEWNAIEILSQGKRIRTTLNGVQLYDARLDDASKDAQMLKNPLATRRLTGFIGLQDHTDSPRFRNIRIRVLPPQSQPAG